MKRFFDLGRFSKSPLKRWLFGGVGQMQGPDESEGRESDSHPWYKVMCLTGVDYFSTLGYQPGIAFLAAGLLSPLATLILILLTLFGALPIYRKVADASPHGEGSIAMLENLLPQWKGKLFVLMLLGFVATDFIITITLSAADATAHVIENPFTPNALNHPIIITLILIGLLGAIFIKGFKEAMGVAVILVVVYLVLNVIVVSLGLFEVVTHPSLLPDWKNHLFEQHGNPIEMIAIALILFPKLALGLSGFETGVAVMPLVRGDRGDSPELPQGRIRNTKHLLTTAAVLMSVLLMASSLSTTLLIPAEAFAPGGAANGRALSYLAHHFFGDIFGSVYDLSTITILWFAGASAMAGLLNIVPRYLPRYGMAPDWAKATRPLVLIFTVIAFAVTLIFRANVDAQGGAYATGVLVLMTSAAVAVTMSAWKSGPARWGFALITLVFVYTTIVNIIERPEGIKIASFFIISIIISSLISRVLRTTELRVERIQLDQTARRFLDEASASQGILRCVANRRNAGDVAEYEAKEREQREDNHIPLEDPIYFLEVNVADASEFAEVLDVRGIEVGRYQIFRIESAAVPNAIAAFLLHVRDATGKIPHVYFGWSEGNPMIYLFKYLVFGEGDTAPVTREVLRKAEHDPERRPAVHVGG